MKPIEEVVEKYNQEQPNLRWFSPPSYESLVESLEYVIKLESHDRDYSGDSRYVLYDNNTGRWGVLIFGWGSCPGCDSLEACNNIKDVEDLRNDLHSSIVWRDSRVQLLEYFKTHDWEGDYSYHTNEMKEFINSAIKELLSI